MTSYDEKKDWMIKLGFPGWFAVYAWGGLVELKAVYDDDGNRVYDKDGEAVWDEVRVGIGNRISRICQDNYRWCHKTHQRDIND